MQPGGLAAFTADFLERYGDRIGSETMRQHAGKKVFNAALVRHIREELSCDNDLFPLKDEWGVSLRDIYGGPEQEEYELADEYEARLESWRADKKRKAAKHPSSYPASDFIKYCAEHAESDLEEWLGGKHGFCVNPEITLDAPPEWFFELEQSLTDYIADLHAEIQSRTVVTAIGELINDALEYAWAERCMVHINGLARRGKTHQVKQWCASHPGRVRYVQVPPGHDDLSFYREIARSLGTAGGASYSPAKIKRRVEDAIQDCGIMLVFDEAQFLFSQQNEVRTSPKRINWLMTAVVNKGIPVALVSTEQFDSYQKTVVKSTGWASEQLDGRIAFRQDLPTTLPEEDLEAVSRLYLPDSDDEVITWLAWFAKASGKYLAGIESAAKRARFLAKKTGRTIPAIADLFNAMRQVEPRMAAQLEEYEKDLSVKGDSAQPSQKVCEPVAKRVQTPIRRTEKPIRPNAKQLEKVH